MTNPFPATLPVTATTADREARIRAIQRWMVREVLKYTVRGRRGVGVTAYHVLRDVRNARRMHSDSIAREMGR